MMIAESNPNLLETDFGREIFGLVQNGDLRGEGRGVE